jgi:ribonucleoside-triphosphate reductase|tara:strand:+ start:820 stop:2682 length:1863 start_codon:yes stop_codon:yes gene_type:complete
MNNSISILSDITVHMKYARFLPELQRRETWIELCIRNMEMHQKKYPELEKDITDVYVNYVVPKKILPSMRSMQFAGKSIDVNPSRIYNCAYLPVDSYYAFSEAMFLLLGGTGVGYSVQHHHVEQLPEISKPNPSRTKRFVVGDSIEGWADAVKVLMKTYFGKTTSTIRFDFSDIRAKGTELVTSGGKAPGPEPLKVCIAKITALLNEKKDGSSLSPLEAHKIMCYLADAVLAGGIRRAAMISLFSANDTQMLSCKSGNWWELNPELGRANNSVVLLRHRADKAFFNDIWERIKDSGAGEPGVYWTNDKDWGTNPCCEIALRPFQFCNLVEINASNVESQEDYNARSKAAAFIATLQAGYTDFHYLREKWKKTTEKDALIGVSMTGIASNKIFNYDLEEAAKFAEEENIRISGIIGINKSARRTAVKPAGTTSLVLGSSSGIHAWHADYYIRRIRVGKDEAIYKYLAKNHPELVEDEVFNPTIQAVISVPQQAPKGAITRHNETALDLLERVKKVSIEWVRPGHTDGQNTHNVSATISVKPNEWGIVGEWMWANREYYNGLAVLPLNEHTYKQAPFEDISKEVYEAMETNLHSIDLTKVVEEQDNTDLKESLACSGSSCEI